MAAFTETAFSVDDDAPHFRRNLLISHIISLFLQSALYGAFVVTFTMGLHKLLSRKQPKSASRRNLILLATNTSMLILATAHMAETIRMIVSGFVTHGTDAKAIYEWFLGYYGGTVSDILAEQLLIYVTQVTVIFGGFMIYRILVVWKKKVVVIVPGIFLIADLTMGYGGPASVDTAVFEQIYYCSAFVTNLLFTGLMLWRILPSLWSTVGWYRASVEAVIQSGAIFSVLSTVLVVTTFVSPNIERVLALSILSPMLGLVLGLMLLSIARESEDTLEELPLLNAPDRPVP